MTSIGMYLRFPVVVTLLICLTHESLSFEYQKPFPLVEEISNTAQIRVSNEAHEAFANITFPIAVVSVIGPKASGKSFFLNKLLQLSCNEGFNVGDLHGRSRKGIWGVLINIKIEGAQSVVLYLDTDAVDRVGNTEFYDDRIFAIATVMSSVLIYNLPETIHVIDLDHLSFSFELAQEFYGRVKGPDVPFEPMKLLWLIQREFLEGKSVEQVVHDALLTVPNHNGNKNIEMVNQIRDSISIMGYNITAFSLPQPHLQRSKLCDMLDDELDPTYIKNMGQLIPFVANMIRLKTLQGQPLHGKEFLSLLDQILEVANHVEIPSTGSQMDLFNHMVVEQCLQLYVQKMAGLHLPIGQHEIQGLHRSSIDEARQCSVNHYLGGGFQTTKVLLKLEEEIQKIYRYLIVDNECQSAKLCEGIYKRCIDVFDKITLPSLKKITEVSKQCNIDFEQQCIGPAKNYYEQRVKKLLERSSALARRIYDERLHCIWIAVGVLLLVMVTVAGARVYWRKKMMRSELELLPVHRPLHRD